MSENNLREFAKYFYHIRGWEISKGILENLIAISPPLSTASFHMVTLMFMKDGDIKTLPLTFVTVGLAKTFINSFKNSVSLKVIK